MTQKEIIHLDLNEEANANAVDTMARTLFHIAEQVVFKSIPQEVLENAQISPHTIREAITSVMCNVFVQALVGGLGCGHKDHVKMMTDRIIAKLPEVVAEVTSQMPSSEDAPAQDMEVDAGEPPKWMN